MKAPRRRYSVSLSPNEAKAAFKLLCELNEFVHQPMHYEPQSISAFRSGVIESIDALSAMIKLRLSATPISAHNQDIQIPSLRLKEFLSVIWIFKVISDPPDRDTMEFYSTLTYQKYIHKLLYKEFGAIFSYEEAGEIAESECSPLEYLRAS